MSRTLRGGALTVMVTALAVLALQAQGSVAERQAGDGPWRSDDPNVEVVAVDGFEYDVPRDVAVVAYVVKRDQVMTGSTVHLRLFLRDAGGEFLPMPPFQTEATGSLAAARIGDAFVLVPAEAQEQP